MNQAAGGSGSAALGSLGLSDVELAVYEALIDRGSATAPDLVGSGAGGLRHFGRILSGLEAKGLVTRVEGRPVKYTAVPPEVGLELLLVQREDELRRAKLATLQLTQRFHEERAKRDVSGLIEIVTGDRGVNERYSAVHHTAREQLRIMVRPPFHQTTEENRALTTQAHEKNLRVRNIVNPSYLELDGLLANARADIAAGEQYRVIANVPLKLFVADDRVALVPLEIRSQGIHSAVLFHASALLDALVEVFETCWAIAQPLDLSGPGEDQRGWTGESVTAEEQDLLALLTAGIPDGVIARQLGLSHTTLQRRIHSLKTRLGAATRFQAGLQAAQRGWITDVGVAEGSASQGRPRQ